MYGLTDNIVAGPAGQIQAQAAGSFVAGPSGTFTPAPAGHTPVYPATEPIPPSGAGFVPIDTIPANRPISPPGGGMIYSSGSTSGPIPGPSAYVPVSQATNGGFLGGGGGGVSGGGGGAISGGGGGVISGGGGGAISVGGGGGIGIAGGGGMSGGGGGGISGGGGGGIGISGGGGGGVSGGGGGSISGAGGGGGGISGGAGVSGGGGGMSYSSSSGVGIPPLEMRGGQAPTSATGSTPVTSGTGGFSVTPGGHTVGSPAGSVTPPPASRFHAPQHSHVAHHPMSVNSYVTHGEAYQPYKAPYVWEGRPQASPPPPFLAGDYLKPSAYEPPHILFQDERSAMVTVDASIGARGAMNISETNIQTLHQDFSHTNNVEFTSNTLNQRNLVMDNSTTRQVEQSFPEYSNVTVNLVFAQPQPLPEPTGRASLVGGPLLAQVA